LDDLRKRIMNELFVAPSVVLPIVGGATAWLMSWAVGGIDWLNAAGLVGVLAGIGWFATRFIFQLDSITEKAMRDQVMEQIRQEERKLDDLAMRLRADRDPRTEDYLLLLRTNRAEIERVAQTPGIQIRSMEIVRQARQLFWAAIDQLEQSLKMFDLAQQVSGPARREALEQRERFLNEAHESAEHLREAVATFRVFVDKNQERDMDALQRDLAASIEAAKRSEERMKELESSPDYEAFLKD
jgi:hypothetical protein